MFEPQENQEYSTFLEQEISSAKNGQRPQLPLLVNSSGRDIELLSWFKTNRKEIEKTLLQFGVIHLRGFSPGNVEMFENFAALHSCEGLDYTGGITPRRGVSSRLFHSTDLPPEYSIPLHNELAYSDNWPMTLMFYCEKEPGKMGETPIADCRKIIRSLPEELKRKLIQRELKHVHNYHNGGGPGLSWQESFYTKDRAVVEDFCNKNCINYKWMPDGSLRTEKVVPAISRHPVTNEIVWFNNLLVHHPYNLGYETYNEIFQNFGENYFPTMIYYGDGQMIEYETFCQLKELIADLTISFPWQRGDIMLIDNMLAMHGRNPFEGDRKILLSMANPMSRNKLKPIETKTVTKKVFIHEVIKTVSRINPSKTALIFNEQYCSYSELETRSNQLAHYLLGMNTRPKSPIIISLDRSIDFVVTLIACLKAGFPFIPLDPTTPKARVEYIVQESNAEVIISQKSSCDLANSNNTAHFISLDRNREVISSQPSTSPVTDISMQDIAFIIYTSGSTGKPKGVCISHAAFTFESLGVSERLQINKEDIMIHLAAVSFILSIRQVMIPLMNAIPLVIAPNDILHDPLKALELIKQRRVSLVDFIPSYWLNLNQLLSDLDPCERDELLDNKLRQIISVGEAFIPQNYDLWHNTFHHQAKVLNVYGQTETCGPITFYSLESEVDKSIPIGKAIPGIRILILNDKLQRVPKGEEGEIYISAPNLANGYLKQESLSQKKFISSPFSDGKLYKTGDRGQEDSNGNIIHLGRKDHQIKLLGNRIDLNEVEAAIKNLGAIRDVAVIATESQDIDKCLIAYFTPVKDDVEIKDLKQELSLVLPNYMIPSKFIPIKSMPLTANGKLDRKQLLASPQKPSHKTKTNDQKKSLPLQIIDIWQEVLKESNIDSDSDFFELGGNSLQATQVVSRIRKNLTVNLSLRDLMENSSIRKICEKINSLNNQKQDEKIVTIPKRNDSTKAPSLSFSQARLWFLEKLAGPSPTYNIVRAYQLNGTLEKDLFSKSINAVIEKHETLRTDFQENSYGTFQNINPATTTIIQNIDIQEDQKTLQSIIEKEVTHIFSINKGPLIRLTLIKATPKQHILVINLHHIISDRWSINILLNDLSTAYSLALQKRNIALAPLEIQYADFSAWQTQQMTGALLQQNLDYWKQTLEGIPPLLELPLDRPRLALQTNEGGMEKIHLPSGVAQGLRQLSQEHGATLFMTIQTAFSILLSRYSGQKDICIGTPIANRNHQQIEGLIGFFVNTLVLRSSLEGDPTFLELLHKNKANILGAYEHQDFPFEKLIEELKPERNLSYNPIFQVMIDMKNTGSESLNLDGIEATEIEVFTNTAKFEISLSIYENDEDISFIIEYKKALFNSETIRMILKHFSILLESITNSTNSPVSQLAIVTPEEEEYFCITCNKTDENFPTDLLIHQTFELQAQISPERKALQFINSYMTYKELNESSNQLARVLLDRGISPRDCIAICIERSFEMVIAILAVLKSGATYIPIDPNYPRKRIAFILQDTNAKLTLSHSSLKEKVDNQNQNALFLDLEKDTLEKKEKHNLDIKIKLQDSAYIIYTSGSTGKPKGVVIAHSAILNHMLWRKSTFAYSSNDIFIQKTPFSFDASIWEFYQAFYFGAKLIIAEPEGHKNGSYLIDIIQKESISVIQVVPSLLRLLLQNSDFKRCTSLRYIFSGGETLTLELQQKLYSSLNAKLVNLYGPSEATIDATFYPVPVSNLQNPVPIGKAVSNAKTYILDQNLKIVPTGIIGEIYVGGAGLAKEYLNRPELTKEKFILSPFNKSERLYKTGDRALYLADGNIVFMGRLDHQVKVRGCRIELDEINAAIKLHDAVADSAVIVREDSPDNKQITSYIVPKTETIDLKALRDRLKAQLPDYMLPSQFITIAKMPLSINGKIDYKLLPKPDMSNRNLTNNYIAPCNATEDVLVIIWQDVLEIPKVGIHDDFFELGGHSLIATQIISRIKSSFGIELPLRTVFESPSIYELNHIIEERRQQARDVKEIAKIEPIAQGNQAPLSYAQQRMWFLYKLEGGSATYNIPNIQYIKGKLDRLVLEKSLNEIIARHEVLRTTFIEIEQEPIQFIHPKLNLTIEEEDYSQLEPNEKEKIIKDIQKNEFLEVFDLAKGPLINFRMLKIDEDHFSLLFRIHHSISDGWSMVLFYNELSKIYNAYIKNEPSPLSPLAVQYSDFSHWQQKRMQENAFSSQLEYWKKNLAGATPLLKLPTDFPRPIKQSYNGRNENFSFSPKTSIAIKELCAKTGTTLFMVLQTLFALILSRYSNQKDIVIGFPIANRNRREVENLIGCFVNTLPLRAQLDPEDNFIELLKEVRSSILNAYDNQDLPLDKLVEEIQPQRDSSYSPLFQVLFVLHAEDHDVYHFDNTHATTHLIDNSNSKFDLILSTWENNDTIEGKFIYNTDLFESSRVQRMVSHFQTLTEQVLADPTIQIKGYNLLSEAENRQIIQSWNETSSAFSKGATIHEIFEEQAELYPDETAIIFEEENYSYREVNKRANQMAHKLITQGFLVKDKAALLMERSLDAIIAIIAILKAGGSYVSIDHKAPTNRIENMLDDFKPKAIFIQNSCLNLIKNDRLPAISFNTHEDDFNDQNDENLNLPISSENCAYICYTSGSTGVPKGVCVNHSNVMRLVKNTNYINILNDDTLLQYAPISFDASTFEIWGALLNGAKLVIMPPEFASLAKIGSAVRDNHVSILWVTTGLFNMMVEERLDDLKGVKSILTGGEAISPKHAKIALDGLKHSRIINCYGPTENTTFTTFHQITQRSFSSDSIPIGRPISNTTTYILDEYMKPLPVGIPGELYTGGEGVAQGYLNRQELTSEKFLPNPYVDGDILYKTGDLACYRKNGDINFLGRIDSQVKIRGYRVELAEIEKALDSSPLLNDSYLNVTTDSSGCKTLTAYIVANQLHKNIDKALREELQKKLPEYMLPTHIITLEKLPLNANGKVDKNKLPSSNKSPQEKTAKQNLPAQTPLQKELVLIWEKVLGRKNIGIGDNFFSLGGHSLMMTRLISIINNSICPQLPLKSLFQAPSPAQMAQVIEKINKGQATSNTSQKQDHALFWIGGGIQYFEIFSKYQDPEQELVLLESYWQKKYKSDFIGLTMEKLTDEYIKEIKQHQEHGPYLIGGYSIGGLIAYEAARRLKEVGEEVNLLFLLDPSLPLGILSTQDVSKAELAKIDRSFTAKLKTNFMEFKKLKPVNQFKFILNKIKRVSLLTLQRISYKTLFAFNMPLSNYLLHTYALDVQYPELIRNFHAQKYPGKIVAFHGQQHINQSQKIWTKIADEVEYNSLPTSAHKEVLMDPVAEEWSKALRDILANHKKN